jgi:serine protease AprX
MAKKYRVIVHGMHEAEISLARNTVSKARATEAFVVGEADEAQIKSLKDAGLIVQTTSEIDANGVAVRPGRPETPGRGAMPLPGQLRSLTASVPNVRVVPNVDLTRPNVYLIEINGPLFPDYEQKLRALGVKLMQSYRDGFYSAFLTAQQVTAVGALDFVAGLEIYDANPTVAPTGGPLASIIAPPPTAGGLRMITYDVRLHRAEDLNKVLDWLKTHNVDVAGHSARKIRIYLLENSTTLSDLVNLPEVQSCEEYVPPKLFNDRARTLLKINSPGGPAVPLDGTGQIVAVADTGIDDQHPDFSGRIHGRIGLGRPGVTDDPDGHGTHVAGSILGDGSASNGMFMGTAPGARLYFQSVLDSGGELGGLPLDINDLFDPAYQAGARIHNNSWGAATVSTYTLNSIEVDEFVGSHRDMLVVIAAGNEGQASKRKNTPKGVVDWLSIGAPATAKNALTVGASCSDRTSGGYSLMTWGQGWPNDYPDLPISGERVSGDPDALAAFSSRGPSDDRRIKPDVVAPGTDIVSTKSRLAPATHFWAPHTNSHYAYMGGTSMATPLVSGCAALVRQYYVDKANHEPSAALLRATLVNGARWLGGANANASNPTGVVPAGNFDQGFGAVNMVTTIPNPGNPSLVLAFIDNWKQSATQLAATGARRRYMIQVTGGTTLRVCLAYTDAPGRGLQNNLNLFVQLPNNQKIIGNEQLRNSLNIPDVDNNVEVVRITNPQPGPYIIQVSATNLLHAPQDFALVVVGEFAPANLQSI